MNLLYIVEHRSYENGEISTLNAYLASSMDKALDFIKENKEYESGDLWWWAVYPMAVDQEDSFDELFIYNKKGEHIFWQPSEGETPVTFGKTYHFDLDVGPYNYLNNYIMEGKLVHTENETLQFENVKYYQNDTLVKKERSETFHIDDVHGLYKIKQK